MNLKSKGFTLIELLVVIAIISLLSSVVLASVREAREKAQIARFSEEMNQLLLALELYRTDNGKYPYEDEAYFFTKDMNNTDQYATGRLPLYDSAVLGNYLASVPEPVQVDDSLSFSWQYYVNGMTSKYRCKGDTVLPKFVIRVQHSDTYKEKEAVSNWRSLEFSVNGSTWGNALYAGSANDNYKVCYSGI